MEKHTFLTDAFYDNVFALVSTFNKFLENKNLIEEKEIYFSGGIMFFIVSDSVESREILKEIITDFEQYKSFQCDENGDVIQGFDLGLLQEIHYKHFGLDNEVIYWRERECFELRATLENDEED